MDEHAREEAGGKSEAGIEEEGEGGLGRGSTDGGKS